MIDEHCACGESSLEGRVIKSEEVDKGLDEALQPLSLGDQFIGSGFYSPYIKLRELIFGAKVRVYDTLKKVGFPFYL
jgi:hypothetical protein